MAGTVDQLLVQIDATAAGMRRELQRAERSIGDFERKADRSVGMVERRFDRMGSTLKSSLGGLGALLGGAALGRDLLSTITQFEALDQRLLTLTGSAEAFNREQEYIRETTKRLSTDLAATTEQYARLLTLQNSGLITNQQARALLEGFADAAAATGASTEQLNQVMYGLSQALSSGTVRAEEFNQVTEPMPGLLQAMEKAAGLSAGGLRRLVNEGEVTSNMFGNIMVAALQTFAGEAEKRSDTLQGKWNQLNTTWTELQLRLEEPVVDVLLPILETAKDLTETLGPLVTKWLEFEATMRRIRNLPLVALGIMDPPAPEGEVYGPPMPPAATMTLPPIVNTGTKPNGKGKGRTGGTRGKSEAEKAADEAKRAAEREAEAIASVTDALRFEQEQILRTAREQEIYTQLRAAGIPVTHEAAAGIVDLAGKLYDLNKASDDLTALMESGDKDAIFGLGPAKIDAVGDSLDQLGQAALGGLQHALVATGGRFENLEQVAVSAISHIITELIRMQQTADAAGKTGPLSGILKAVGGFIGGFGGGGGASLGPIVPDAAAYGIPGGGFAMGGRPPVGIASLVGERGPEVFVPDVAGTVVPNFAVKPQGRTAQNGPMTVRVEINGAVGNTEVRSLVEQGVREGIARARPGLIKDSYQFTAHQAREYRFP